jgi:hypothetical protein
MFSGLSYKTVEQVLVLSSKLNSIFSQEMALSGEVTGEVTVGVDMISLSIVRNVISLSLCKF